MVDNPNTALHNAIAGQRITSTITLHVSTTDNPVPGGGTANTAFLRGGPQGPNAVAASVTALFWLETLQGGRRIAAVKRVLLTGMSGTGKSSVIHALSARGFKAVDTDDGW